jgi:hypothetical protein
MRIVTSDPANSTNLELKIFKAMARPASVLTSLM